MRSAVRALGPIEPMKPLQLPPPNPDELMQPANIATMAEYSIATHQQMVNLAKVTGASLDESRRLRETMAEAANQQRTATIWMIVLTVAIAILTVFIAWQAIGFWPLELT